MKRNLTRKIAPWLVAGIVAVGAVACEAGYERGFEEEEGIGEVGEGIGEEEIGEEEIGEEEVGEEEVGEED